MDLTGELRLENTYSSFPYPTSRAGMTEENGRDETTQPTALERRALAAIWADVDAAVGEKMFGLPEPGLQAERLFLHWPSRSYADVQRPGLRAIRPRRTGAI